eukprot:186209-Prymnesium_polylepis.1
MSWLATAMEEANSDFEDDDPRKRSPSSGYVQPTTRKMLPVAEGGADESEEEFEGTRDRGSSLETDHLRRSSIQDLPYCGAPGGEGAAAVRVQAAVRGRAARDRVKKQARCAPRPIGTDGRRAAWPRAPAGDNGSRAAAPRMLLRRAVCEPGVLLRESLAR